MTSDEVLATPRPLHILFAWNQAGDEEGPRKLIASATESEEGLVTTYEASPAQSIAVTVGVSPF